jgi:hypothetical protein
MCAMDGVFLLLLLFVRRMDGWMRRRRTERVSEGDGTGGNDVDDEDKKRREQIMKIKIKGGRKEDKR